jgi:cell division protein FtsB
MAWLLSVALIAIGYYLSEIRFLELEWLTRSGCLIVLLGVWSSIGAIIAERILISKLNIQHRIVLSRSKIKLRKMKAPQDYIDKEIDTIEDDFDDRIEVIKDNVRYQLGILEVSLLMTGTFIWGFGDLLFKINF